MKTLDNSVTSIEQLNNLIETEDAVIIYFSHEQCNVCKVLKPKVAELLKKNYPKVKMFYSDTVKNPEIAAQNSIFTVPTIVAFMGGKEYFRKSRNIGIAELDELIERPYSMIFDEE